MDIPKEGHFNLFLSVIMQKTIFVQSTGVKDPSPAQGLSCIGKAEIHSQQTVLEAPQRTVGFCTLPSQDNVSVGLYVACLPFVWLTKRYQFQRHEGLLPLLVSKAATKWNSWVVIQSQLDWLVCLSQERAAMVFKCIPGETIRECL